MPALLLFVIPRLSVLRVTPTPPESWSFVPTVWSTLKRPPVRRAPVFSMMPDSCLSEIEAK